MESFMIEKSFRCTQTFTVQSKEQKRFQKLQTPFNEDDWDFDEKNPRSS